MRDFKMKKSLKKEHLNLIFGYFVFILTVLWGSLFSLKSYSSDSEISEPVFSDSYLEVQDLPSISFDPNNTVKIISEFHNHTQPQSSVLMVLREKQKGPRDSSGKLILSNLDLAEDSPFLKDLKKNYPKVEMKIRHFKERNNEYSTFVSEINNVPEGAAPYIVLVPYNEYLQALNEKVSSINKNLFRDEDEDIPRASAPPLFVSNEVLGKVAEDNTNERRKQKPRQHLRHGRKAH